MSESAELDKNICGINITPLVDVSLVLVLIFMVAVPLSIVHGIDVKRQALGRYGLSTPQENILVKLTRKEISIRDAKGEYKTIQPADLNSVLSQMIQLSPTKNLLLQCDRDVAHGQTVSILDIAKQNGANDVSLYGGQ